MNSYYLLEGGKEDFHLMNCFEPIGKDSFESFMIIERNSGSLEPYNKGKE